MGTMDMNEIYRRLLPGQFGNPVPPPPMPPADVAPPTPPPSATSPDPSVTDEYRKSLALLPKPPLRSDMPHPGMGSRLATAAISGFVGGQEGSKSARAVTDRFYNEPYDKAMEQYTVQDKAAQERMKALLPMAEIEQRGKETAATKAAADEDRRARVQEEQRHNREVEKLTGSRQESGTAVAMRKLGLNPDGTPIPEEQLDAFTRSKIARNRAEDEYKAALEDLAKAKNDPNSPIFKQAQQKVEIAKNRALQSGLSEQATQMLAEQYLATGQLPSMGLGPQLRTPVFNKASELNAAKGQTGADISSQQASFKAESASLTDLQKMYDSTTAFANMSKGNMKQARTFVEKAVNAGAPWVNRPLRAIDAGALGSGDQVAYNAAVKLAGIDAARVITQARQQGVLSDNARQEIDQIAGPGVPLESLTPTQLVRLFQVFETDMDNRTKFLQQQIQTRKQGMSGGTSQPGGAEQGGAAPLTNFHVNPQTKERIGWNGTAWVPAPPQ